MVGADTAKRIIDPRYYGNSQVMIDVGFLWYVLCAFALYLNKDAIPAWSLPVQCGLQVTSRFGANIHMTTVGVYSFEIPRVSRFCILLSQMSTSSKHVLVWQNPSKVC